jgi:hypothetical protein
MARAFIAKAFLRLSDTRTVIVCVRESLGHVPFVTPSSGNGEKVGIVPCEYVRYRERVSTACDNSRIKDSFQIL